MAVWTINGIDISEQFGIYIKKGSYDALLDLGQMKDYLSEDFREDNGERVCFDMPRKQARNVVIEFYLVSDTEEEFWRRYDDFGKFIAGDVLDLHLVLHDRTHRLLFVGSNGYHRLTRSWRGKMVHQLSLTFREPNPAFVFTQDNLLALEDGGIVLDEDEEGGFLMSVI